MTPDIIRNVSPRAKHSRNVAESLARHSTEVSVQPVRIELLERTHEPRLIAGLDRFSAAGGGWIDGDVVRPGFARNGGAFCQSRGRSNPGRTRWPGDPRVRAWTSTELPATRDRSMGFCIYNNVAIAANAAREQGVERIAIIDWDVHHGNGTQDIFYDRRDVLYCSMHQSGIYPGGGWPHELGNEKGEGFTLNVPIRSGHGDDSMLRAIDEIFAPAIEAYGPELIMISAGFDAHADDPLADLTATEFGFAQMADRICQLSETFCENRVVAVLEGGYDVRALARSTAAVISVLDGAVPDPASLPAVELPQESGTGLIDE
ncbi:MAG: histone deacetylase [Thermomicrobiales bacterium]